MHSSADCSPTYPISKALDHLPFDVEDLVTLALTNKIETIIVMYRSGVYSSLETEVKAHQTIATFAQITYANFKDPRFRPAFEDCIIRQMRPNRASGDIARNHIVRQESVELLPSKARERDEFLAKILEQLPISLVLKKTLPGTPGITRSSTATHTDSVDLEEVAERNVSTPLLDCSENPGLLTGSERYTNMWGKSNRRMLSSFAEFSVVRSRSPYLVLPRWPEALDQFTASDGLRNVSFEDCIEITLAFASGIVFLHKHLIAHLDIKPANLVFDSAGSSCCTQDY
ncbi:hypothetical protein D9757_006528 [Collybiopsis confluens]|uniref:Protein kinase domain-containing protein n=1 Tax=Collybiopsis confluens TaxID=2823264 RepID=A0A8H5MB95_9AGAR|nr:hypothetical protein D9757_006528 [Collybiopsis confluens]